MANNHERDKDEDGDSDDGFDLQPPDNTKLPDGITKEVLKEGEGLKKPKPGDEVTVHYVGTLEADGSEFDSSRSRDKPFTFTLGQGQVIKGWDLGVATMKKGETAKLTLASQFAYGESGSPPQIPAGATLMFEVELLSWVSKDDLFQDGGVIKRKVKDGSGWKKPRLDDEVLINVIIKDKGEKVVMEKNSFEYGIGTSALGPIGKAVDRALTEMDKGEQVQLSCTPLYAYGDAADARGDSTVTIELLQMFETLDVSFEKNKSLMKKQIVEGEGWDKPKDCCKVKLKVDAATDGTSALPGFTAKTLEFVAGDGEVCDAIECAVSEMKLKEKAVLTSNDTSLVLEEQLGLKEVKSDKVVLTLELLEYEKTEDTWNMDEDEKIAHGTSRKEAGSKLFRAGRTRMALERYKKVISLYSHIDNMQNENKAKAKELKKVCELNSAACQLKFKEFIEAKKHCENVLKEDSTNAKALYRRAQAYLGLKEYDLCSADVKKNIELEPQSREARALLKEVQACIKEVDRNAKGLFSKMCQGLGKGPIPEPEVAKSFTPPDRPPAPAEAKEYGRY